MLLLLFLSLDLHSYTQNSLLSANPKTKTRGISQNSFLLSFLRIYSNSLRNVFSRKQFLCKKAFPLCYHFLSYFWKTIFFGFFPAHFEAFWKVFLFRTLFSNIQFLVALIFLRGRSHDTFNFFRSKYSSSKRIWCFLQKGWKYSGDRDQELRDKVSQGSYLLTSWKLG